MKANSQQNKSNENNNLLLCNTKGTEYKATTYENVKFNSYGCCVIPKVLNMKHHNYERIRQNITVVWVIPKVLNMKAPQLASV